MEIVGLIIAGLVIFFGIVVGASMICSWLRVINDTLEKIHIDLDRLYKPDSKKVSK